MRLKGFLILLIWGCSKVVFKILSIILAFRAVSENRGKACYTENMELQVLEAAQNFIRMSQIDIWRLRLQVDFFERNKIIKC